MSTRNKKERRLVPTETQEINFWAAYRKSPFPPPAELERYETLYPGAAKSVFENFVKQSDHRMELEKQVIERDSKRADKAQRNSFILTLSTLILSGILFVLDKDTLGIAAIFTAIAPIIIAFITSSIARKRDLDNKRKTMDIR